MLGICLAQAYAHRAGVRELLGLVDVELVIIAFALTLKDYQLVMCLGDGALEFGARRGQILAGGLEVVAVLFNGLALGIELVLELFPARIGLTMADRDGAGVGHRTRFGGRYGLSLNRERIKLGIQQVHL